MKSLFFGTPWTKCRKQKRCTKGNLVGVEKEKNIKNLKLKKF